MLSTNVFLISSIGSPCSPTDQIVSPSWPVTMARWVTSPESSPSLRSFTGSPVLWLPTLGSQAANTISTSLCAPLLSSIWLQDTLLIFQITSQARGQGRSSGELSLPPHMHVLNMEQLPLSGQSSCMTSGQLISELSAIMGAFYLCKTDWENTSCQIRGLTCALASPHAVTLYKSTTLPAPRLKLLSIWASLIGLLALLPSSY